MAVNAVDAGLDELTCRVAALADELARLALTGQGKPLAGVNELADAGGDVSDPATDAARITSIRVLETLKSAACALQVTTSASFADAQRADQIRRGVAPSRASRGIAAQIGLARRESPNKGQRLLGLAASLVQEMPCTLAALARGDLNEWRATLIVRETAVLSREHRAMVDEELCGPSGNAAGMGDQAIERAARAIGQRLDPGAAWARAQKAIRERRVTIRPAPDCMVRLTALLPVVQGVGVYAELCRAADAAIATGQALRDTGEDAADDGESGTPLTRAALMADELVARVLGKHCADHQEFACEGTSEPAVEVQLIMTDWTLFGLDDEPAHLTNYGPIPAPLARRIASGEACGEAGETAVGQAAVRWIRRLYRQPPAGQDPRAGQDPSGSQRPPSGQGFGRSLVAMDSHRRLFTEAMRRFFVARDQFCRTPWCDALIRHIDHVDPAVNGGPTSAGNAQGLCEACNYAKQAPGWHQEVSSADSSGSSTSSGVDSTGGCTSGEIVTTTPTGHRYISSPPDLPGMPGVRKQPWRQATGTAPRESAA